jgi:hypothetical protein
MAKVKKVPVCKTHLPTFIQTVSRDDIFVIDNLGHEVTTAELCTVCKYRTDGLTDGNIMESFLLSKKVIVSDKTHLHTKENASIYWLTRLMVMFAIYLSLYLGLAELRSIMPGSGNPFAVTFFEIIMLGVISLLIFEMLDMRVLGGRV